MAQAPEHPGDLTASDVFSTGVWSARGRQAHPWRRYRLHQNRRRPPECSTRLARCVHPRESCQPITAAIPRTSTPPGSCGCVNLAPMATSIEETLRCPWSAAQGPGLKWRWAAAGSLAGPKWAGNICGCSEMPRHRRSARKDQAAEGKRLAGAVHRVSSLLLISFKVQGQPAGILGLPQRAAARRLGREPAAAAETDRHQLWPPASNACRISARLAADRGARRARADAAANDGLWDFDLDPTSSYLSPRWKAMLGYDDAEPDGADRLARPGASGRPVARAGRDPRARRPAPRRCSRACTACATATASTAG